MRRALVAFGILLVGGVAWWLLGRFDLPPGAEAPATRRTAASEDAVSHPVASREPDSSNAPHLRGRSRRTPDDDVLVVRVTDPGGNPVHAADLLYTTGGRSPLDTDTEYELVFDGQAVLERPADGRTLNLLVTGPRGSDGDRLNLLPRQVRVAAGSRGPIEIVLVPGRVVRGRVVDSDGDPAANVRVHMARAQAAGLLRRRWTALGPYAERGGRLRTGPDGRFEAVGLPHDSFAFRVADGDTWRGSSWVDVGPTTDSIRFVVHRLRPFCVLAVDARGEPIHDLSVRIRKHDPFKWTQRSGRTDEKGVFDVGLLPAGDLVDVHAVAPVGGPLCPSVERRGVRPTDGRYVLRVPDPVTIEGHVVDQAGDPVPWGTVEVRGATPELRHVHAKAPLQHGRFAVRRLEPGTYRLSARGPPAYAPLVHQEVRAPDAGLRLTLGPGAEAVGVVVAPRSRGVQAIKVRWYVSEDVVREGKVSGDRSFRIAGLPPEPGTLYVRGPGFADCAMLENVRPAEGPFRIRVEKGDVVRGQVDGFVREHHHRLRLELRRGPLRVPVTISEYRGDFTTDSVPPGRYDLVLRLDDRVAGRVEGVRAGARGVAVPLARAPEEDRR